MNGLRRLTLICHFISLIQPSRALSVPRQSHSVPPHPRSSSSSSISSSATLTRARLEHPIPARPSACTPPPTNCFVGEAKKRRMREKERRERTENKKKEREKLCPDGKMLRPVRSSVALHTRGYQIKSLVVSVAHPSVRPSAREKKKGAGG